VTHKRSGTTPRVTARKCPAACILAPHADSRGDGRPDGGGPDTRLWASREFPNLAFPEQLNPNVAPPGWRPEFFDYLYLGFTNATAFSPTDVMPLARWAKAAMTVQAVTSLFILGLVIARAVNILR
jgi:hypothetical protein